MNIVADTARTGGVKTAIVEAQLKKHGTDQTTLLEKNMRSICVYVNHNQIQPIVWRFLAHLP